MILLLLLSVLSVKAQNWNCPTTVISSTLSYIPYNSTKLVAAPSTNFSCTYTYKIPDGMLLKLTINDQLSGNDAIYYTDSVFDTYQLPNPISGYVRYIAAPSGSVRVNLSSSKSSLLISAEIVDISSKYTYVTYSTGTAISLNAMRNNLITISSTNKPVLNIALSTSNTTDLAIRDVFVYNGNSVKSKMIGRLNSTISQLITSNSVTLFNPYNTVSVSYIVANDASKISKYVSYNAYILESGSSKIVNFKSGSGLNGYTIFIPTGNPTMYLNQLYFDVGTITNQGYIDFVPLSPTHNLAPAIRYDAQTFTSSYLPQLMPCQMVTIELYRSYIRAAISQFPVNFTQIYDGRKGYVFSPSYWSASATSKIDFGLIATSGQYNITTRIDTVHLSKTGENLQVEVKNNANSVYKKQYNSTVTNQKSSSAVGTSLSVQLNTVQTSTGATLAKIYYEMAYVKSASYGNFLLTALMGIIFTCMRS